MFAIHKKKKIGVFTLIICLATASRAESIAPHVSTEKQIDFTAEQLVQWVWQQNPGIAELKSAVEVAIYRINPAGAIDDPTMEYSLAPRTFGREGQGLNQKIQFSQKLPWPGTLAARKAAAENKATMAHQDVASLRLQLATTAKLAYAEWYFIQRALAIHQSTHRLLGELIAVAETNYAAGEILQQEVLQAKMEGVILERHLLKLKRSETDIKAQINTLLNRDTEMDLPIPTEVGSTYTLPSLNELRQQTVANHPELHRVDAKLAAQSAEIVIATKAFYPDLRFTAGYNSLWDEPDKRPTVGLSINIPFDRSKREAVLSSAKAELRRTEYQRDNLRAELMGELAQAHSALSESIDAVAICEDALLPLAQDYFQAALSDYESGLGSFSSLITAEREKLATEETLERNRADVQRRIAVLERWLGGPLKNRTQSQMGEKP
jgi:outer membrane protein TolC